ncbi:type IV secretion system protein VirB4 [Sphingomonas laterariae]|uniref:Type IV secretion system protein VirB4 n=1 Tax=Edaphosphingomonas laterariae TaxID=861865 RepID=A0A239J1B7_9SPHN|nr:conjugal transfer protein TrbE [Sphingomonas laterariae]SNS99248.1 type IV secretion system protein VirB4 [Sphingomonas laterariae]
MLALHEYRRRADRLADHLPWAAIVAPGIILNKDGSFQRTFAFRGPDLESATPAELVSISARINNMLRRFGSGWALYFEADRHEAQGYPASDFPDIASRLIDAERRASFTVAARHFESRYRLTLQYLPPEDAVAQAGQMLIEPRIEEHPRRDWRRELDQFRTETDRTLDLLSAILPEVSALDDGDLLTYLHGTISGRGHKIAAPEIPFYLDGLLADTPLIGGLEPMLGDRHLRTLTVLGFPNMSQPGRLDALNDQAFAYRWVTRFIALDREQATRTLTRLRRQWFNKRKSLSALLREIMYNQAAALIDSDADNKVADADQALQSLGEGLVSFGYLTTTITVADETHAGVTDKLRATERIINGLGFTTVRESVNAVEAWLSSLPGQAYANVRQPLVHSLNLAHLMPLSAVWAGPANNAHLAGPPLFQAITGGSTPFRFSTHAGDVGHMLIAGPTGAGKSVLLAFIAFQFRRYPHARIFIFDKGWSARAAVLAMGGRHYPLGASDHGDGTSALAFQPLRHIDEEDERVWAMTWITSLIEHETILVTPDIKESLWSALTSLATAPVEQRTLTGLSLLLQSAPLRSALASYTLAGPYGHLLDAAEDGLEIGTLECFETEALMQRPAIVAPVLTYLFHRLEKQFDGSPTLLILDEAWLFLDQPLFAARIREWLKTLRKKNVAVIFATQSLADICENRIAPAIIESCPQRILLPNPRADEPQSRDAYLRFGLNHRQIELISRATPKRHYYLQSALGNRLFELGLGPAAAALCGASGPAAQATIDALLAIHGDEDFATRFLAASGLPWAEALLPAPDDGDRR